MGNYDYTSVDPYGWIVFPGRSEDPSSFSNEQQAGTHLCRQAYDENEYYNFQGYCCQALYKHDDAYSNDEVVIAFIVDSYATED